MNWLINVPWVRQLMTFLICEAVSAWADYLGKFVGILPIELEPA